MQKKSLEALLRSKEASGEYLLPEALLGWRKEVIGKDLLAFLERDG